MITKIKDAITHLVCTIAQVTAKTKETLAPAVKVGTVIAAIYSISMTVLLILCGFLGFSMDWLLEFPGIDFVANAMMVISMITVVLSGSIIEALGILLKALDAGLSLASIPSGGITSGAFLVSLVIGAICFVIPLMLAGLVIFFAPIVPILMHQSRKNGDNWYDYEE